MHTDYLTTFMNDKVPVTKAMGITVVQSDSNGVIFKASIDANINDKGVAFGGSLFSVASLASWAVVDFLLKQRNMDAKIFVHTADSKFWCTCYSRFYCYMPTPPLMTRSIFSLR